MGRVGSNIGNDGDYDEPPALVRVLGRDGDIVIRLDGLPGWPTWRRRYTREQFLRALERCLDEGSL